MSRPIGLVCNKFLRFCCIINEESQAEEPKSKSRRSIRLPADIGSNNSSFCFDLCEQSRREIKMLILFSGVELGLQKNNNCYPRAQIIQNFFSIDETELHYKNYNHKRVPLIQCRVSCRSVNFSDD